MTPEQIVRALSERWRFSIAEDSSLWADLRAALRERDAALAKLRAARDRYNNTEGDDNAMMDMLQALDELFDGPAPE